MNASAKKTVEKIHEDQLSNALSERYLNYAMSTIMDRALPDVRDGLKPVHRRLMFAMRELKLNPKSGFKKCARVVGDVMGKFHPHGDSAIYDAMVRLAQDFSVRYPLVDGQGNFGNIDGDSAAAMRYTEARLTRAAEILMEGIDNDAINFIPTYDGLESEPEVMPAGFPNLLANGAMGIAVGMATNIPPHNLEELCDALIYLIRHPNVDTSRLIDFVAAPDFPTGGILTTSKDQIIKNYETGNGAFTIQSKWEREDLQYGNYQIVITEIPYQVQKSRLIEKTAELLEAKKLPLMVDIRDESAEDLRIVIEPKNRTTDPKVIMALLFKLTDFESKFNMNMNVLDKNHIPRVMGLKDVLNEYIDHRRDVLVRMTKHRLAKIAHRLEVLGGHLTAYLNLDEVIKIIRENDEPKPILMKRFNLSEIQVDAILNMRLRALRKLEEMEIQKEDKELRAEQKTLNDLLGSEDKISAKLVDEFKVIKKEFSKKTDLGRRMTNVVEGVESIEISADQFIEKEPITVVVSEKGWIRALKGHSDLSAGFAFKDGDKQRLAFHAQTTDKLLVFADDGKFYTLSADKLPRGRGFGEPISLMIDLGAAKIADIFVYEKGRKLLVASTMGHGFVVESDGLIAHTRTGKTVLNLPSGSKASLCVPIEEGDDRVAVLGSHRSLLIFNLDDLPTLGRGKGVILQKYRDAKTKLADVMTFKADEGFYWETGRGKTVVKDFRMWQGRRASAGHTPPTGFPKKNRFKG